MDMVLRGQGIGSTPEESMRRLATKAGVSVPGDGERRASRESGAGALLPMVTGVTMGAAGWPPSAPVAAAVSGLADVFVSRLPMAALGVSDPREWSRSDWLSDLIRHSAYGLITGTTYAAMTDGDPSRWPCPKSSVAGLANCFRIDFGCPHVRGTMA